jgi:hypothetical protein
MLADRGLSGRSSHRLLVPSDVTPDSQARVNEGEPPPVPELVEGSEDSQRDGNNSKCQDQTGHGRFRSCVTTDP